MKETYEIVVETIKEDLTFSLPQDASLETLEKAIRSDLQNNNVMFLEIIDKGKTYYINKQQIVKVYIK